MAPSCCVYEAETHKHIDRQPNHREVVKGGEEVRSPGMVCACVGWMGKNNAPICWMAEQWDRDRDRGKMGLKHAVMLGYEGERQRHRDGGLIRPRRAIQTSPLPARSGKAVCKLWFVF